MGLDVRKGDEGMKVINESYGNGEKQRQEALVSSNFNGPLPLV
jgi:hypothetical protein